MVKCMACHLSSILCYTMCLLVIPLSKLAFSSNKAGGLDEFMTDPYCQIKCLKAIRWPGGFTNSKEI